MTTEQWRIGDIAVTKVHETTLDHERAVDVLRITDADLDRHRDWMAPYLGPAGEMLMSVHAFGIEVGGIRIVVDTCIGNGRYYGEHPNLQIFNGLQTTFLDDLAAAGFGRDDVDFVICTHLHPDHVGWNTVFEDGEWLPTFRRARYLLSRVDADAWRTLEGAHNPWAIAVQPLVDHDQVTFVDVPYVVTPGIEIFGTPGHTLGHVSVRISSGAERAFITGDMVHSPVQLVEPAWTYRYDADAALAAASVRRLLDEVADAEALVLGTHFPTPTAGRIETTTDGWRFDAASSSLEPKGTP